MTRSMHPISLRSIRTYDEARNASALRHRCYVTTPGLDQLGSLDPVSGLDVDEFDLCSTHLGLFSSSGVMIGTVRLTGHEPTLTGRYFERLVHEHPSLLQARGPRMSSLPMFGYLTQSGAVESYVEGRVEHGERVVEAGRLAVDPAARFAFARARVWLAEVFIGAIVAYVLGDGPDSARADRVLVSCSPEHAGMYRPFGFQEVPGTGPEFQPSLGVWRTCLQATPADVPAELLERTA